MNAFTFLVGTGIVLAVISLVRPSWPLCGVAILLIGAALLIGK